ncbi:hypothetical protein F8388_025792 [Cannabis sativa]|uniref:Uncharacterized protein n=1 Tax=Cannabis sativa TaxID=3483 RepID=A0A7J6F9M6_CANSA|nr:hypothetical protein F8388_025792 [Cannabis sativa]
MVPLDEASLIPLSPCLKYQNYSFDIWSFNAILRLFRSHNSQHDIDKIFVFMIVFSLGLNMLINDPLKELIKHFLNSLHSLCQALQVKWSKERNVISQVRSGTQVHQLFDNFLETLRIKLVIRVLLPKHHPTTHIGITCCNLGAQIDCHRSIFHGVNKMADLFSSHSSESAYLETT